MVVLFHDKELNDVSTKNAQQSIGETEESRCKGLQELKERIMKVECLNPYLDDDFLLKYLRVAKFDVKKAFERLRKYYEAHRTYSHVFDTYYPSAATTSLTARHFWASPIRATDNSIIVVHKRGLFNPSTMVFENMFLLDLLILDFLAENTITQLCGVTVILDFKGYRFHHFLQDTPQRLRMALNCFQNAFPLRFRNIHVMNVKSVFSILLSLVYPFLTKKIKSRLHVHSNKNDLLSSFSAEVLPEEYGGKIPAHDLIDLVLEVRKKEDFYKDQLQYGYKKF